MGLHDDFEEVPPLIWDGETTSARPPQCVPAGEVRVLRDAQPSREQQPGDAGLIDQAPIPRQTDRAANANPAHQAEVADRALATDQAQAEAPDRAIATILAQVADQAEAVGQASATIQAQVADQARVAGQASRTIQAQVADQALRWTRAIATPQLRTSPRQTGRTLGAVNQNRTRRNARPPPAPRRH
ncbi:hypothetical protein [Actinoplanes sp. NPDC026619]|uniref:hypothetical protein n=1 Tax=Actinoplanes sp. NPDC026619 TaxID=3155798 RepID=UPI00340AC00A